jgi:hypothetical protein
MATYHSREALESEVREEAVCTPAVAVAAAVGTAAVVEVVTMMKLATTEVVAVVDLPSHTPITPPIPALNQV